MQTSYFVSVTIPVLLITISSYSSVVADDSTFCYEEDGCGYDDMYYQSTNWMGKIPDETPLRSLSIPGTHDSMARYGKTEFDEPLAQCQSMTLRKQLEHGIRAFDIRNRHINDAFAIHHEMIYQHARFGKDVAKVMSDFLDENPSETIIMHHQNEYKPEGNTRSYTETMKWYMSIYPKLTKLKGSHANRMTLGEARGKILINYDSYADYQKQNDWTVESCDERDDKWNRISKLVDTARTHPNSKYLYINYVSGTGGAECYNPFSGCYPGLCVKGLAELLNNKLNTKLSFLPHKRKSTTNRNYQHGFSRLSSHYKHYQAKSFPL